MAEERAGRRSPLVLELCLEDLRVPPGDVGGYRFDVEASAATLR